MISNFPDPYAGGIRSPQRRQLPAVAAVPAVVVEDATSGFVGEIIAVEKQAGAFVVILEDRHRQRRTYPLGPGYLIDGNPVQLVRPPAAGADTASPGAVSSHAAGVGKSTRTASGSTAVANCPARVAQAGRIYVEGRHDAELVERVWGDDLRIEGVVVEYLQGVDDLARVVEQFRPGPQCRLGVLVDHLVPGSKESRLAAQVRHPQVLIVGHPFIDVWQAVRPASLKLNAWPQVPPGEDWKTGICQRLHATHADWPLTPPQAWRHILAQVNSYADLEPALLARVEQLIDFVTVGGSGDYTQS